MSEQLTQEQQAAIAAAQAADSAAAAALGQVTPQAQGADAESAAPPVSADDCREEAAMVAEIFAEALQAKYPGVGVSPETRGRIANKLAPVMQKYNFSMRYAAEIDLAVTVSMVWYQVHKAAQPARAPVQEA